MAEAKVSCENAKTGNGDRGYLAAVFTSLLTRFYHRCVFVDRTIVCLNHVPCAAQGRTGNGIRPVALDKFSCKKKRCKMMTCVQGREKSC